MQTCRSAQISLMRNCSEGLGVSSQKSALERNSETSGGGGGVVGIMCVCVCVCVWDRGWGGWSCKFDPDSHPHLRMLRWVL